MDRGRPCRRWLCFGARNGARRAELGRLTEARCDGQNGPRRNGRIGDVLRRACGAFGSRRNLGGVMVVGKKSGDSQQMEVSAAESARRYYDEMHALYVRHIGYTCQAGLIHGMHDDPYRSTVLYALEECRLPRNAQILDAGAGACGPSVHICEAMKEATVVAVTISAVQADGGRRLVRSSGLADRISVMVGDYHSLPHGDNTFDGVWFLESTGYSDDLRRLFREMFRVTKAGGKIYVKDVFRRDGVLTVGQRAELDEFNSVYAHHCTRTIGECAAAIGDAGFECIGAKRLARASTRLADAAMWEGEGDQRVLSAFGRRHYRPYARLPIVFGQILGMKPA